MNPYTEDQKPGSPEIAGLDRTQTRQIGPAQRQPGFLTLSGAGCFSFSPANIRLKIFRQSA